MFNVCNITFLLLLSTLCLLPFLNLLAISFSSKSAVVAGKVWVFPVGFTWNAYRYLLQKVDFFRAFLFSLVRVFLGTTISLAVTALMSYPLAFAKKQLAGRRFYLAIVILSMFFNGGLIPNFILMIKLELYNTFWVYILPGMFTFYNMVIFMSFFRAIPESLMESARLDGASEFTVYWKIVMPNAKPVIATIGLFTAVYHWNDYYQGVVYIRDKTLEPLQTILYKLLAETSMTAQQQQAMLALGGTTTSATVKYAAMFVGALPILCLYPFIQKYLVKGVMLGAIKG